jgi:hypothetical protein
MAIGLPTDLWRAVMRRREFIVGLGAAAWPLVGRAQLRLPIVGWLGTAASPEDAGETITWVKQGAAHLLPRVTDAARLVGEGRGLIRTRKIRPGAKNVTARDVIAGQA